MFEVFALLHLTHEGRRGIFGAGGKGCPKNFMLGQLHAVITLQWVDKVDKLQKRMKVKDFTFKGFSSDIARKTLHECRLCRLIFSLPSTCFGT